MKQGGGAIHLITKSLIHRSIQCRTAWILVTTAVTVAALLSAGVPFAHWFVT